MFSHHFFQFLEKIHSVSYINLKKKKKKIVFLKMNEFFKLMNKARKEGLDSFVYNGEKYVKSTTKTGLIYYTSKKKK